MTYHKKIGILGCGWLGFPLAMSLLARGYQVKGSTTSRARVPQLSSAGIEPHLVYLNSGGITGNSENFLKDLEMLIIAVPPGIKKNPDLGFSEGMKKLSEALGKTTIEKILFISSISVYRSTVDIPIYREDAPPNGTSRSAQELIGAERILLEGPCSATILRFGGLIGQDRHPVNYLSGRTNLQDPLGPVNLIHQKDCIGIIEEIIRKNKFGTIYNGVFPGYPTRESFYTKKARELNLVVPQFSQTSSSKGKIVVSSKVIQELNYVFQEQI